MASNSTPIQIREYHLPKGELRRKVLITGIIMLISAKKSLIEPGSPVYDQVLSYDRRLYTAARWIQNGLFYFLFGAHAIETPIFAWTRLRKHNVRPLSLVWIQWLLSCFVGGKFVFQQFDELVAFKAAGRNPN